MTPAQAQLTALRYQPFIYAIDIVGFDWSAATLALQVRSDRAAPGTALVDLSRATAGTQGLSTTVATTGGVPTTTLTIQIDQTTIDALPGFPDDPNALVQLRYDLVVTPAGGVKQRWLEGVFAISEGVTH